MPTKDVTDLLADLDEAVRHRERRTLEPEQIEALMAEIGGDDEGDSLGKEPEPATRAQIDTIRSELDQLEAML